MLGTGIAGAMGPYLTIALRDIDPRIPFALASIVLMLVTLGMITAERRLAAAPRPASPPVRSFGTMTTPAIVFALGMITLALGYQMHFAIDSAPLFLRFTNAASLQWLMPVFWIGFNISMFPAGIITNRLGGYTVMAGAARYPRGPFGAGSRADGGRAVCCRCGLGCDSYERLHRRLCDW
ncbi:MAG: hypothetical protein WCC81_05310 [Pseudolabrys sp.]